MKPRLSRSGCTGTGKPAAEVQLLRGFGVLGSAGSDSRFGVWGLGFRGVWFLDFRAFWS